MAIAWAALVSAIVYRLDSERSQTARVRLTLTIGVLTLVAAIALPAVVA